MQDLNYKFLKADYYCIIGEVAKTVKVRHGYNAISSHYYITEEKGELELLKCSFPQEYVIWGKPHVCLHSKRHMHCEVCITARIESWDLVRSALWDFNHRSNLHSERSALWDIFHHSRQCIMGLSIHTDRSALWDIFHHSRQCIMGLSILTDRSALWDIIHHSRQCIMGPCIHTDRSALWDIFHHSRQCIMGPCIHTDRSALWDIIQHSRQCIMGETFTHCLQHQRKYQQIGWSWNYLPNIYMSPHQSG